MGKRFLKVMLLAVMVCTALGGKPVLQSLAWLGMIVTYSHENGLSQGIADTFSGDRPCELCQSIKAQAQQPSEARRPDLEAMRLVADDPDREVALLSVRQATPRTSFFLNKSQIYCSRSDRPAVPPPRFA